MPNAGAKQPPVQRFQGDVARLIGADAADSSRFGVAVSGGPDSMALIWLAMQAFPGCVAAATVDHQLRAEARAEAEMVAHYCAQADIPHAILTPPEPISGTLQSSARAARYTLLDQWRTDTGIDWLLTAHHADDQMETLLMRLNRSSGVGGLAGVRARNGVVLRPLLGWRRSELAQIVEAQNVPHVHDPSNDDTRFDRVAMRQRLRDVDWLDPLAFARSAEALADAQEALEWTVARIAAEHVRYDDHGDILLTKHDFPAEIQRRLLVHMLMLADPALPPPRGSTVDQALVHLEAGKRAMIGDWLITGGVSWRVRRAPPRSSARSVNALV